MLCRCGYDDKDGGPHPCHGQGYTCRKPATQRFYGLRPVALAGASMKFGASETWSCDSCWAEYERRIAEGR